MFTFLQPRTLKSPTYIPYCRLVFRVELDKFIKASKIHRNFVISRFIRPFYHIGNLIFCNNVPQYRVFKKKNMVLNIDI